MKDELYVSIAQKYNLSKATVSRAARHCSKVDSEIRQLILDELKNSNHIDTGHKDIYCILPDIPQYFWHDVRRGIMENRSADVSMKLNIYTKTVDEAAILTYLDEAEQMTPYAVIISSILTDAIREKLEKMIKNTFILILSEFGEMKNSFYIGANSYEDGYRLGQLCREKYHADKTIVITPEEDRNSELRAKGFEDAAGNGEKSIINVSFDKKTLFQKNSAAILARMLAPYKDIAECIYSTMGCPFLHLSVKKAGFADSTVILAHDTFPSADTSVLPENFNAVINQDVYSQGKAAIEAAELFVRTRRYPQSKFTYIPSFILNS